MTGPTRQDILQTALALAEPRGWEALRLHEVAQELACGLEAIRCHFPEKEALVDAWFDLADQAMLKAADDPACRQLTRRERLEYLLMAWLETLAAHRKVTRQMIMGKFEPGHLHVLLPGILRVSRTVQWWREAANCQAHDLQRALDEILYTGIYSATFAYWLWDDSGQSSRTRKKLQGLLDRAAGCAFDEL